jgi:hypothetical protein
VLWDNGPINAFGRKKTEERGEFGKIWITI